MCADECVLFVGMCVIEGRCGKVNVLMRVGICVCLSVHSRVCVDECGGVCK